METLAQPAGGQGSGHMGCLLPIWHGDTSSLCSSPTRELSRRSPSHPGLPGPVLPNLVSPRWFPELVCGQCVCITASSRTFSPSPSSGGLSPRIHIWFILVLKKHFLARGFHFQEGCPRSVGDGLTGGPAAAHLLPSPSLPRSRTLFS